MRTRDNCMQLVEHLPRKQNVVGLSPAEAPLSWVSCIALGVSRSDSLYLVLALSFLHP